MADPAGSDEANKTASWGALDVIAWKVVPEWVGGGKGYIQRYKDDWVRTNKDLIVQFAAKEKIPAVLLAGVCWIEVGGDPQLIDSVAFAVRSFDWCGPDWVDRNMTITKEPTRTSFGAVSMQLRVAAETLGKDPSKMSWSEARELATKLEHDRFNIEIVARHLRRLIEGDGNGGSLPNLTDEQIRVAGARYNRGAGISREALLKNTSYGDFIVKNKGRFEGLLK